MTDLTKVASDLIDEIKLVCPRFSMPSKASDREKLVKLWAGALSSTSYPPNVYEEALRSWLMDATSESNPPMPGDILRHCRKAIERIEQDPRRRKKLEKWREQRMNDRDRAMFGT